MKFQYTIHFNTISVITNENILHTDGPEGPVVERKCAKCGYDRMSYATLQLRSADEGQTVFYTCIKCKYVNYNIYLYFDEQVINICTCIK